MKTAWIAGLVAATVAGAADPKVLELPFLKADREAREVRIEARATGVDAKTQAEFFLIATNSGHDYESIAVVKALPSHVHQALEFIGIPAGKPVDPKALRFWPRGERVVGELEWRDGGTSTGDLRRVRLESTLIDTRTGQPLPEDGLVFTGSARVPDAAGTGVVYAADEFEPNSVASAFNLETTVLDIPRKGGQNALYDYQVVNPAHVLPQDLPLTVILRPEPRPDGTPRVADLDLVVTRPAAEGQPVRYSLRDPRGAVRVDGGTAGDVARVLDDLARADRDAHLTIRVDPGVPVGLLGPVGEAVAALTDRHGARIESPPADQLYYRAFSPDPSFRSRAERPSQPWELRFRRAGAGGWTARLAKVENTRSVITDEPTFRVEEYPADTAAALRKALDEHGPGLPVLLVFAPPAMSYGDLMAFLGPVLKTHPVVHLFTE
jgi:hypothetical protein